MPKSTKLKVIKVRNETDNPLYVSVCDYDGITIWISETEVSSNHINVPQVENDGQFHIIQVKRE